MTEIIDFEIWDGPDECPECWAILTEDGLCWYCDNPARIWLNEPEQP